MLSVSVKQATMSHINKHGSIAMIMPLPKVTCNKARQRCPIVAVPVEVALSLGSGDINARCSDDAHSYFLQECGKYKGVAEPGCSFILWPLQV